MKLLVVIVNYKTPSLAIDCLASLAPEIARVPGAHVIITDNASGDDSVAKIQTAIDNNGWNWATLMPLSSNGGFAYGNNQAIEPALRSSDAPDYVYLLNPDTIIQSGAVSALIDFLDKHPAVGIAGGRALNPDHSVRNSAFRFHTVLSELEGSIRLGFISKLLHKHVVASPPPDEPAPADWVSGASMMIRRDVFDRIGLLDDGYFMYFEETDFCLRARRAGFECWYVPASKIIHLVGQSSGVTGAKRTERRRPRYWFESRHRYFRRNFGFARMLAADVMWAGGFAISSVLNKLRRRPRTDPPWLWCDFVRYNLTSWSRR